MIFSESELKLKIPLEAELQEKEPPIIPLTQVVDNLPLFLNVDTSNLHGAIEFLSHYYMFLVGSKEHYATKPPNLGYSSQNTLVLFSEFGEPRLTPPLPEGLAVCGFDIKLCQPLSGAHSQTSLTIDVNQFQTALFKDKDEIFRLLGFIRYKELYMHVLEQFALYLNMDGFPFEYISIGKVMPYDHKVAAIRALDLNPTFSAQKLFDVTERIYKKRLRARQELAMRQGYTTDIYVDYSYGRGHHSYGKRVSEVIPDQKLQGYLHEIVKT